MEYDLNIREYWRILRKRKGIILLSALLTGIFSFAMSYMNQPVPVYKSTAMVKIEKSSTTTGIYLEALSWSGADYLETQETIITSYPIIEKTAKELGLIPNHMAPADIRSDSKMINIVLGLIDHVEAARAGDSNLINITAKSKNPKKAQDIANVLARVYKEEHTAEVNKRTFEARAFIEKQLQEVAGKLRAAEENLIRFREERNVVSLSSQTTSLLSQLALVEAEYHTESKVMHDMEFMLNRLKKVQANSLPAKESFFVDNAPPLYINLNTKLVNLLLEKDTLQLAFTEEHPQIVEIDSRIQEITRNMAANLSDAIAVAGAKTESFKKKVDKYQKQLDLLPGKGLMLARLERDVNFNEKIYVLLEEKLQEARIMEAAQIEEVTIVKPALEPGSPINNSSVNLKAVMGLIVGLIIGLVFAFIYETFDTSIGAVQEVEEFVGVRVLGIIPEVDAKSLKESLLETRDKQDLSKKFMNRVMSMTTHFMPNSTIAECYRSVRANVRFSDFEKQMKTIAFTSAVASEGKSSSIVNVAIAMAQAYNRVLLIDADLRKPDIARLFGIPEQPGLTEIILGSYEWREVVQNITDIMLGEMDVDDIMLTPGLDNLHIIAGGRMPMNPAELLTSESFDDLLKAVYNDYDVILLDLPPILAAADTTIIGSRVDGVVMVYQAGNTARGALRRAKLQLDHARANIIGIILTGLKAEVSLDFGELHYQRYTYGQREGQSTSKTKKWFKSFPAKESLTNLFKKNKSENEHITPGMALKLRWKLLVVLLAASLLAFGLYLLKIS